MATDAGQRKLELHSVRICPSIKIKLILVLLCEEETWGKGRNFNNASKKIQDILIFWNREIALSFLIQSFAIFFSKSCYI